MSEVGPCGTMTNPAPRVRRWGWYFEYSPLARCPSSSGTDFGERHEQGHAFTRRPSKTILRFVLF
jgi:hypothetical protein